jgi:hypothetical protein
VLILKVVKVLCFDTLLQVLILKALSFADLLAVLRHKKSGCLIAKPAARFPGAIVNGIKYTQMVIQVKEENSSWQTLLE